MRLFFLGLKNGIQKRGINVFLHTAHCTSEMKYILMIIDLLYYVLQHAWPCLDRVSSLVLSSAWQTLRKYYIFIEDIIVKNSIFPIQKRKTFQDLSCKV